MVGLDVYNPDGFTNQKYQDVQAVAGNKPMAIGQCQLLPTPTQLTSQPKWVYFMGWSELTTQKNSTEQIKNTWLAPNTLTLDELPGW